jgi:hypothetical protein
MSFGVNITTGTPPSVSSNGSFSHLIADSERTTFGIQDAQLKDAVRQYFGRAPNDAYVRSPTPWGDLYQTYGWPQVETNVRVISATVTDNSLTQTALASKTLKNNSSITGTFTAQLSQSVTDTVETNWSQQNSVSVTQSVNYGIKIIGGETTFNYTYTWGQGGSQSTSVTVGDAVGVEVVLAPGQSVLATLSAGRGTLTVRVVYQATLSGLVAVNYDPPEQGHHFWAFDVNAVLRAGNLPTTYQITTDITIGYYSNGEVILTDPTTGKPYKVYSFAKPGVGHGLRALL